MTTLSMLNHSQVVQRWVWVCFLRSMRRQFHLNDLNRAIYAFWDSAVNDTEALCSKIRNVPLTMD